MTDLAATSQDPSGEIRVELFRVDLTAIGGGTLCFTPSSASPLTFGGIVYTPFAVEATGFELNGQGALPQPSLKLTNVTSAATALLLAYGDLLGAEVTRIVTFAKYLDDGEEANPSQYYPLDVFTIDQKVSDKPTEVELKLKAKFDQQGVKLPKRLILRDVCGWRYRTWTGTAFDYTTATCPYVADAAYDADNQSTSPDKDICNQRKSGCIARFGDGVRPFGGFPGAGSARSVASSS